MKKVLFSTLVLMSVSATAFAQERDNRSAWAKSQDMYVEPTLRMKQTELYTPVDANNVPTGQTVISNETVQVFGPSGEVKASGTVQPTTAPTSAPEVAVPTAPTAAVPQPPAAPPAPTAPVVPAVEAQPAIQDLSRPLQ